MQYRLFTNDALEMSVDSAEVTVLCDTVHTVSWSVGNVSSFRWPAHGNLQGSEVEDSGIVMKTLRMYFPNTYLKGKFEVSEENQTILHPHLPTLLSCFLVWNSNSFHGPLFRIEIPTTQVNKIDTV